jgi:hypothetical protein
LLLLLLLLLPTLPGVSLHAPKKGVENVVGVNVLLELRLSKS